jgi:hydrogenase maturation protease
VTDVVIIGVGNPYRRDDGVGQAAAEALAEKLPAIKVVLLDGEPTRLVDAWEGHQVAIVLDAVRRGDPPGTIHRFLVGTEPLPEAFLHPSTHGAGLESAVALGRALDRNPEEMIVYGIEPADMTEGNELSEAVEAALPGLVDELAEEVRALCA